MQNQAIQNSNKTLTRKLVLAAIAMFGFGFALVPLYNVMCDALGINGRNSAIETGEYQQNLKPKPADMQVDMSREITIEFLATLNQNMPWEFKAMTRKMKVHPGETYQVEYYAKNLSNDTVVAQAVPSLVPGLAWKYFSKIECFCFSNQTFAPGEEKVMPMVFYVDPNLPKDVQVLSMSYTFFDTERRTNASVTQNAQQVVQHANNRDYGVN